MLTIYEATENADKCEGRGPMTVFARFLNTSDAERAVRGRGVQGIGDGIVVPVPVFESYAAWQDYEHSALRRSALAKLTPAEREALGL